MGGGASERNGGDRGPDEPSCMIETNPEPVEDASTIEAVDSDTALAIAGSTPFDRLPPEMIVRAFGVDYGHVHPREGGDLYVTRYGWPTLAQLLPANWYSDQWYARHGIKLPGSGHVYHASTRPVRGKSIDVVVKFSRVAREISLEVATTFPDDITPEIIANARFNSPMEEFGLVTELRRGALGRSSSASSRNVRWPSMLPPKSSSCGSRP